MGWDVRWTGDLLSRGGGDFYEVMMRWTWQVDDGYIGLFETASSWTLDSFLVAHLLARDGPGLAAGMTSL